MSARLRFAPSPTGRLHIGGARTALFNWAYARRLGGAFLLRIEDTDPERSRPEHERAILEGLRWLGIDWDEGPDVGGGHGPYRQSERMEGYREFAERMLAEGIAYRAFDPPARVEALREAWLASGERPSYEGAELSPEEGRRRAQDEPAVVRFRVPPGETRFADEIRGEVVFRNEEVDDWVMLRSDGSPTYNLVVVLDDAAMEISHVLRGEEHLTNTPKQLLLYRALGLPAPAFAHLPLMLGKDKKKLSKRTGDTALEDYREKGYPPEAVVNFLCLQGWALDDRTDVFSVEELVRRFDPSDVSKGGAVFDPDKFLWMAGEYIRADTLERLAERCAPFVVSEGLLPAAELERRRDWYCAAVATEKERIRLYSDMPGRLRYLFVPDDQVPYAEKAEKGARRHGDAPEVLESYRSFLAEELERGRSFDELREETRRFLEEREIKLPRLYQPLRCALTGAPGGADLFEVMALLGAERVLERIAHGARRLG